MIQYNKKLEVGDFINEINAASDRANIAFVALKFDRSRPWFKEDGGTYNIIQYLVTECLDKLHKSKGKDENLATGGIKVEMFVDEENIINLGIYFDLT